MNAVLALSRLKQLGVPAVRTADAAASFGLSTSATSATLARLARGGLVQPVRAGLWWLEDRVDPLRLPEFLTWPLPSYVSLQTALHLHGLTEQLPVVTWAVTLARTQRVTTRAGVVSLHRVAPALFDGYATTARGVRLASAEKALFDMAYLSGGRSRHFAAVPELTLPRGFRAGDLDHWVERIPSARRRTMTAGRLAQWLRAARAARRVRAG